MDINESKNIDQIKLQELMGSLQTHELDLEVPIIRKRFATSFYSQRRSQ